MRINERIILIASLSCLATCNRVSPHHNHPAESHGEKVLKRNDEFDIEDDLAVSAQTHDSSVLLTTPSARGTDRNSKRAKRIDDVDGSFKIRHREQRRKRQNRRTEGEQERGWHFCSDGSKPKKVKELNDTLQNGMNFMCSDMYPTSTCCYNHDLNMEIVGDKVRIGSTFV